MPNITATPGQFQPSDPTERPRSTATSRPRPSTTRPKSGKPGISRPRPKSTGPALTGTPSTPGTFVPSEPEGTILPEDEGFTIEQKQSGLSTTAWIAIGVAAAVAIFGTVLTVRRRMRGGWST